MPVLLRLLADHRDAWLVWAVVAVTTVVLPILSISLPFVEKQIIDDVILGGRVALLAPAIVLYGVIWALAIGVGIIGGTFLSYLAERVALNLRRRLFGHASALAVAFAQGEHSARTMALFANDVPAVSGLVGIIVARTLGNVVTIGVAAAAMFALNSQLAIATMLAPLVMAAAAIRVTGPLRPASRRAQEKAAELTERIQEHLAGIREVVAFGRERLDEIRFLENLRELLRMRMRLTFMQRTLQSAQNLFSLGATLVALGFGAYLVIEGRTTLGTVVAIRSLFTLVFVPASQLASTVGEVQQGLGALDRIYAFLDQTPRVPEARAPRPLGAVVGAVAFDRVTFGYEPGRPVLRDISLTVKPGEHVALVGPSGAGKSTLVSLIPRFYDPTDGRVLLDGVDIREFRLDDLRRNIGIVFQNTFLFAGTVRHNIVVGRDSAREDEIIDSARAANAWEFIEGLPQGLDTYVGERGVRLSEGQRQRIAIARALLRDPRVLILDEPTSALDARSEQLLAEALLRLMRGRTSFVIAHRLSTIARADRILVIDAGRIIQEGTHTELLRVGGLYRDFVELQFGAAALLAEAPDG